MATKVIMPQMGESIVEGTIIRWLKKVGERVERDEPLLEITTDKVDTEVPAPAARVLTEILAQENETVNVHTVVAMIDGGAAASDTATETAPPAPEAKAAPAADASTVPSAAPSQTAPRPASGKAGKVRTSPLVQRLAKEHGIDLSQVPGTGEGGRISKKDIEDYLASRGGAPAKASVPSAKPSTRPRLAPEPVKFEGATHAVPMTPMRSRIAEHMVASRRTSAHVSSVFEVEMTRVVETVKQSGAAFQQKHGVKLTYTPFFIHAVVEALKEYPIVNASVEGANIVYKKDVNIGVAVALAEGLIVPVLKRAQEKSFVDYCREVQDLAQRARNKNLKVEDVQEGTFTLTNPGIFGSLFGTPIIHQPQVAILGVGTIEKRPVVRDDAIAVRAMAYLSISFDHRIIDGAVADQFMARLKQILENWDGKVV
ncbi:MAG: dihydrolipoamide acetyltransferase family protein [Acidobacteria bacterium]|nr:dihydrolipoamide acetyltransferase family protein [Acidobacteriota bacterium]